MKKLIFIILSSILLNFSFVKAQDCVDPSLIDPYAICITIYAPVCGCNGITYGNSCQAQTQGGVTSWTTGNCPPVCIDPSLIDPLANCPLEYDPVCGCDGNTYSNSCFAQTQGGVTSWTSGNCNPLDCLDTLYLPGIIPDGFYESILLTYSDGSIPSGETVVFESDTEVKLISNFECAADADFTAEIDPCNFYNLVVGMSSNAYGVSQNFIKTNAGYFELYFDSDITSLCPSNAVQLDVLVNGSLSATEIIEVSNGFVPIPNFLRTYYAPAGASVDVNLTLINSAIPANQQINCLVLGDAFFKLSE